MIGKFEHSFLTIALFSRGQPRQSSAYIDCSGEKRLAIVTA